MNGSTKVSAADERMLVSWLNDHLPADMAGEVSAIARKRIAEDRRRGEAADF